MVLARQTHQTSGCLGSEFFARLTKCTIGLSIVFFFGRCSINEIATIWTVLARGCCCTDLILVLARQTQRTSGGFGGEFFTRFTKFAIYRINIVLFLVLASGASIANCCGIGPLLTCHALFARDGSCRILFLEPTTGAIGTNSQSGTVFFSFGTKLARIR